MFPLNRTGGGRSLRDVRGSLSSSDWSSATVITFASDRPGAKSGVAAQSRARRLFPSRAATRAPATHQGSAPTLMCFHSNTCNYLV